MQSSAKSKGVFNAHFKVSSHEFLTVKEYSNMKLDNCAAKYFAKLVVDEPIEAITSFNGNPSLCTFTSF